MRVARAFSLIEIIVVILLIGIIFSLVLSSYTSKKLDTKLLTIRDIPSYISSISSSEDATLYMYGKKCDKGILKLGEISYIELPSFGFSQEYKTYVRDKDNQIKRVDYEEEKIAKKRENICLKLEFTNGRFIDKLIVVSKRSNYIFSPFYQKVESYDSAEEAHKVYSLEDLELNSIDGYYRE